MASPDAPVFAAGAVTIVGGAEKAGQGRRSGIARAPLSVAPPRPPNPNNLGAAELEKRTLRLAPA